MAIQLTAVKKSGGKRERTPLADIPEDIKTAVAEALAYCGDHPDERVSAKFGSQDEAAEFLNGARDYAYQAEPRLIVTGNTTKSGFARFTVELWGADSGEGEEGVQDAA